MNKLMQATRLVCAYLNTSKLKRQADALLDQPRELVSLVFQYCGSFLQPLQSREELAELLRQIRKLNPRTVLEIGTARGGTLFLWTRLAQPDATVVSIDLPGGRFGGGYSKARGFIYQRFAGKHQTLCLLRGNSHDKSTFENARELLGRNQLDLLFIDGDHTYEGVKTDWEMYQPLVRQGGMVVFHDVAANYEDTQVRKLWDAIKQDFDHREYIVSPRGKFGIGVLTYKKLTAA